MLAVEQQLRHKRDELRDLLSSRKRKLSQIYEVTACPGLRYTPKDQPNDVYVKQLQAFHDVNDLSKGRLFDESSLPFRREIIRTPSTSTTQPQFIKQTAQNDQQARRRSKSPAKSVSQPTRGSSAQPATRPTSPRSSAAARPSSTRPPDDPTDVTDSSEAHLNHSSKKLSSGTARAAETDDAAAQNGPTSGGTDSATEQHVPQQAVKAAPPQLPSIETQDAQSSPTSSNGRPLSQTPAPETASPTTSPGDENAPPPYITRTKLAEARPGDASTPEMTSAAPHKMSVSSTDVEMIDADPTTVFDSPAQTSNSNSLSKSPQQSRVARPSISVDTQNEQKSYFHSRQSSAIVETPGPITNQNPTKQLPATTPTVDSSRRETRIRSGALQKKSVSEILGETPKPSVLSESPATHSARVSEKDRKDKDRSRLSTVVFAKSQRPNLDLDTIEVGRTDQLSNERTKPEERDYMYTLFESKAHSQNRQGSLPYLLQHSHKTISTIDHLVDYQYQAHCRVLKRLYQLQNLDRWSLRQRKRAEEPSRPTSHWDFLLDHAKWMRTDFREERRWKMAAARAAAEACAEWVAADAEGRKALQVKVRPPRRLIDAEMVGDNDGSISSPPGLEPHEEDDSISEDIADPRDVVSSAAPAAIFSLGATDFTFATEKTPAFDKLLNELPLYQPTNIEPDLSKSNLAEKLDSRWKTDIVPVSRYATEKLNVKDFKPPLKRSRYDYDVDDLPPSKRPALEPRETGVALFMPENKHIRDRIHPGHAFRPPAEHPMPSQAFFETRQSSQWLASEDDEVRRQAREYSFNWTLISELMTPPTLYTSGQDRRSAWECFERWIGLEGMPADMAKTPYFKTYSSRIDNAQRNVQAQWEEHERRNGTTPVNSRRKTTLPVRVERKHNRRHLFMLDAMRKLAKKREALRQKAMHSADMAAMRKSNDVHAPRPAIKTPAEWSQLKYEREQKMAKQQEMYKQQLIAHQRAVVQQQRGGHAGQPNGMPVAPQGPGQIRMPGPNGAGVPGMPNGHLQVPNGQPRPHPNMMGMPQGMGMPNGMGGPKGMPQQMASLRGGIAGSPQQIKMQQEQLLRQAQQAQANGTLSSPNIQQASMVNGQGVNASAQFMGAMGANTQASPNVTGTNPSPRPQSSHMPQILSSGSMPKINQLYASLKERNPTMSDEEVRNIATQQLLQWQQQATAAAAGNANRPKVNQAALNAAMGAANSGAFAAAQNQNAMNVNPSVNPSSNMGQGIMSYDQAQQYHQRIRMQQAQQNAARGLQAPNAQGMMNSPVMNMVRPVSQHSQSGSLSRNSATPAREQRSASASTNVNGGQHVQTQSQSQPPTQGQQPSPRAAAPTPMQT